MIQEHVVLCEIRSSILNKHRVYEADCRRICWRMRENEKWRVKVFVTPPTRWDTPIYAIFRGSRSVSPLKPQFHFPRCFCSTRMVWWKRKQRDFSFGVVTILICWLESHIIHWQTAWWVIDRLFSEVQWDFTAEVLLKTLKQPCDWKLLKYYEH